MRKMMAFCLLFLTLWAPIHVTLAQDDESCPLPSKPERTPPAEAVKPFLTLPFAKRHAADIKISEGDKYSPEERAIHGHETHYAVDFDAPQGTQLYAPCDGWAVQGFHTSMLRDAKGSPIIYKEKRIGYGLGHFVQIYCKDSGLFFMTAHMQEVPDYIPSVAHNEDEEKFKRTLEYSPDGIYRQFPDKENWKYVKRGKFIGRVGHSGLGFGEYEVPWRWTENSWDSFHVHMEVYKRTAKGGKDPNARWDPFGWYTAVDKAPYTSLRQSPLGLWLTDSKKRIKYACNNC